MLIPWLTQHGSPLLKLRITLTLPLGLILVISPLILISSNGISCLSSDPIAYPCSNHSQIASLTCSPWLYDEGALVEVDAALNSPEQPILALTFISLQNVLSKSMSLKPVSMAIFFRISGQTCLHDVYIMDKLVCMIFPITDGQTCLHESFITHTS